MVEIKNLVDTIIEGIQEKKGYKIIVADLTNINDTICKYLVICQGNSPSQVSAVAEEVSSYVRKNCGEKPIFIDGKNNAEWVVMDYADIIVHVFVPEARQHYDLEHLWADAKLTNIADLN
jgi:ribosome-associated protein